MIEHLFDLNNNVFTRQQNCTRTRTRTTRSNVSAADGRIAPLICATVFARTLQDDEAQHSVQVDLLVVPLQEGCCPGQAAQDVVDHLRPRRPHCGTQSQRRGQLAARDPHVPTRRETAQAPGVFAQERLGRTAQHGGAGGVRRLRRRLGKGKV